MLKFIFKIDSLKIIHPHYSSKEFSSAKYRLLHLASMTFNFSYIQTEIIY